MRRVAAWLSGVWGGLLVGVGFIGAPAGFAVTTAEIAGRSAGRMFAVEANAGLALAVILLILVRQTDRGQPGSLPAASAFNASVLLVLGALFCTIAGYFVIQPMMAAARAGQGSLSFGALHGISAGFYGVKTLLVLGLAWRLARRQA